MPEEYGGTQVEPPYSHPYELQFKEFVYALNAKKGSISPVGGEPPKKPESI